MQACAKLCCRPDGVRRAAMGGTIASRARASTFLKLINSARSDETALNACRKVYL